MSGLNSSRSSLSLNSVLHGVTQIVRVLRVTCAPEVVEVKLNLTFGLFGDDGRIDGLGGFRLDVDEIGAAGGTDNGQQCDEDDAQSVGLAWLRGVGREIGLGVIAGRIVSDE